MKSALRSAAAGSLAAGAARIISQLPDRIKVAEALIGVTGLQPRFNPACSLHGFFVLSCRLRSSSKGVGCVSRPSSRKSDEQSVTAGYPAALSSALAVVVPKASVRSAARPLAAKGQRRMPDTVSALAGSAGAANADTGFTGDGTGHSASSRQNVRRIWRCGMPASSKGSPSVTKPSFS